MSIVPGERYDIEFTAENSFHCHDLHHASAKTVKRYNFT
ncbi:hypothetical protein B4119_4062 [Parageobacillus caldoxylosilyticus]|uniref:Uncharacterized protein n=1 Tax=Saccharococcus caldoxylosilyticus TaxID=81408 RepID=A0A150M267_9BACL|nr:hypothetical protein B4119_4062 [Parageobacillus caldoxylosilyticus]